MPSIRPSSQPSASAYLKRYTLAAGCALAVLAAILGCASDKVAGTSSGVDNPALTVSFRDGDNSADRITGDLDVYSADQNPAVDPEPLVTIKIKNTSFTNLTGDDFKRAAAAASLARSALSKGAAIPSAVTAFNLVLKTQDNHGGFILGLRYDSIAKAFTRSGDSVIKSLAVTPKPLARYAARIARDAVHGNAGRIFVPGSPFLATLVDSVFTIENLPEGKFPLRLIAGDGNVYPIGDSLDTRDSTLIYHPGTVPVGRIDTAQPNDTIPHFSVEAGAGRTVFLGEAVILEAKLTGIPATDPRVSILWSRIEAGDSLGGLPADSAPNLKDTLRPKPVEGPTAKILTPTNLRTEIQVSGEGVYHFQVTAIVGVKVAVDSMTVLVRVPTTPKPRIIMPQPSDSVRVGKPFDIQWEMPGKGPYTIEVTIDKGAKWLPLAKQLIPKDGLQTFSWVPAHDLASSSICLIRVTDESAPAQVASMEGPFTILP